MTSVLGEPAAGEHGLPAVRAVPAHVDLRQRRVRAQGEARAARRARRPRSASCCAIVALEGLESRRPRQLSGGQQQRVALARALVNRPAALLLDEPLGALDVKLRKQMQLELKRIQTELGTTFVYVTHDQEEALAMSDRIAVMNGGQVEQIGSPREIYEQPTTAFVADFIGSLNALDLTVDELVGGTPSRGSARASGSSSRSAPTAARATPSASPCGPEQIQIGAAGSAVPERGHASTGRSPRSSTSACTRSSTSTRTRAASSATASPTSRSQRLATGVAASRSPGSRSTRPCSRRAC